MTSSEMQVDAVNGSFTKKKMVLSRMLRHRERINKYRGKSWDRPPHFRQKIVFLLLAKEPMNDKITDPYYTTITTGLKLIYETRNY
jgi:hypothetical protein